MIKQRFIIDDCGTLIDVVTRKHYDYVSDVVDVLNDLDSENTHLKYSLGAYMVDLNNYKGKCSALEQENEQLKHRINDYNIALKKLQDLTERKINENEQLKKENEWLKQSNKNLEKIAYPMARWKGDVE